MTVPASRDDRSGPRIVVVGTSGAGKTTLAARIGARLDLPHADMDGFFHGPGWVRRETGEQEVAAFVAGAAWVTERPWATVWERVMERATLVVWLDHPVRLRMARVIRRTVSRSLRRTPLWHGNVEPRLRTILTDPDHIIRWAWRTRRRYDDLPEQLRAWPELPIVRLRSQRAADAWLAGLPLDRSR
jgi:adenylate kinase family enzyme